MEEKPDALSRTRPGRYREEKKMLLTGKTAVISGAASKRGIGRATAELFAQHGARVAILDLDNQAAQEAAASLPKVEHGDHIGIRCNVADRASCDAASAATIAAFGAVNILINNAGITQPVKTLDITGADWERIVSVNMTVAPVRPAVAAEPSTETKAISTYSCTPSGIP